MTEVKITQEQYNHMELLRYEPHKKHKYAKGIIGDKYDVNEDTYFFVYKDATNFYLVFDGEKKEDGRIPLTANILKEKKL